MALVLGYGGTLVLAGEMTAGGLTSFLLYSVYVGFNFGSLRCAEIRVQRIQTSLPACLAVSCVY